MGSRSPQSAEPVSLHERDGIAYLRLERPPRNEMDGKFFEAFARLDFAGLGSAGVRGMVVHGVGRHFSSGAKLSDLRDKVLSNGEEVDRFFEDNIERFQNLADLTFPVVAAISGCCLGSGLELALACHYRVAASNALLGLPEAQFGLMPGCGGSVRLPSLVGRGNAIELVLTGRSLLADEALTMGLVDAVVPKRGLFGAAERLIAGARVVRR